jgi:hypothetical protein
MFERNRVSVIIVFFFGLLISNSQCQIKNLPDMNITIPRVTKEFEKLEFDQNFDGTKEQSSFTSSDGTYIEIEKQSFGFIKRQYLPDSYFIIIKQYFENRNIKEKGVIFNSGYFKIGYWYYYNDQGQLIKEEDSDLNFKFTFQELFFFLRQKKIDLTIGYIELYSGFHTTIEKQVDSKSSSWVVRWLKEPLLIEEIIIDGKTGKVLKTNKIIRKEG